MNVLRNDVEMFHWIALDASSDKPCSVHFCLDWWNLWLPRTFPESALKSNAGRASSWVFRISDSETLAGRELTPAILFLRLMTHYYLLGGRGWIMLMSRILLVYLCKCCNLIDWATRILSAFRMQWPWLLAFCLTNYQFIEISSS